MTEPMNANSEMMLVQQQNELVIAKQELQILKLKSELQNMQAKKASRLEDSLFSPALFEHYSKVAERMANSEMVPQAYRKKPNDVFIAMAKGYQVGFSIEQSLEHISVINGRTCIWGDGLMALALAHPQCESISEDPIYSGNDIIGYQCTVKRKGFEPHVKQFTWQDAQNAGLFGRGAVWKSYPARMLQMRARSMAVRDRFADALLGMEIAEIVREDAQREAIEGEVVTPKAETQVGKLKEILKKSGEQKNTVDVEKGEVQQEKTESQVHNTGSDEREATPEQVAQIIAAMEEQNFDDERMMKAYAYFGVERPAELTEAQAVAFLLKLGKSGKK